MPRIDIVISQADQFTTITALASSPVAFHLIANMQYGYIHGGTRYLTEPEAYSAFDLIDELNLTARVLV